MKAQSFAVYALLAALASCASYYAHQRAVDNVKCVLVCVRLGLSDCGEVCR